MQCRGSDWLLLPSEDEVPERWRQLLCLICLPVRCIVGSMPNFLEVVDKMKERLVSDAKFVEQWKHELESMLPIANRIAHLEAEIDDARMRMMRIATMLGEHRTKEILGSTPKFVREYMQRCKNEMAKGARYNRDPNTSLRSFIEEYLRIVKEAKVGEIVQFLNAIGVDYAKRQTIEGVIKRNTYEFAIIRRGSGKFVRLRES